MKSERDKTLIETTLWSILFSFFFNGPGKGKT